MFWTYTYLASGNFHAIYAGATPAPGAQFGELGDAAGTLWCGLKGYGTNPFPIGPVRLSGDIRVISPERGRFRSRTLSSAGSAVHQWAAIAHHSHRSALL